MGTSGTRTGGWTRSSSNRWVSEAQQMTRVYTRAAQRVQSRIAIACMAGSSRMQNVDNSIAAQAVATHVYIRTSGHHQRRAGARAGVWQRRAHSTGSRASGGAVVVQLSPPAGACRSAQQIPGTTLAL